MRKLSRQISLSKLLSGGNSSSKKKAKQQDVIAGSNLVPPQQAETSPLTAAAASTTDPISHPHKLNAKSRTFSSEFRKLIDFYEKGVSSESSAAATEEGSGNNTAHGGGGMQGNATSTNRDSAASKPRVYPSASTTFPLLFQSSDTSPPSQQLRENLTRATQFILTNETFLHCLYWNVKHEGHREKVVKSLWSLLMLVVESQASSSEMQPNTNTTTEAPQQHNGLVTICSFFEKLLKEEFKAMIESEEDTSTNAVVPTPTHKDTIPSTYFGSSTSIFTKSLDCYISQPHIHAYLRDVLLPFLASLVTQHTLGFSFEMDPKEVVRVEGLSPEETRITNKANLIKYLNMLLEKIYESQTATQMPFVLRFIAKQIDTLAKEDSDTASHPSSSQLIGSFLVSRLLAPCIIAPDYNALLTSDVSISLEQRRNLLLVANVLQHIASHQLYDSENAAEAHMTPLNDFIQSHLDRFDQFVNNVIPADFLIEMHLKRDQVLGSKQELSTTNDDGENESHRVPLLGLEAREPLAPLLLLIDEAYSKEFEDAFHSNKKQLRLLLQTGKKDYTSVIPDQQDSAAVVDTDESMSTGFSQIPESPGVQSMIRHEIEDEIDRVLHKGASDSENVETPTDSEVLNNKSDEEKIRVSEPSPTSFAFTQSSSTTSFANFAQTPSDSNVQSDANLRLRLELNSATKEIIELQKQLEEAQGKQISLQREIQELQQLQQARQHSEQDKNSVYIEIMIGNKRYEGHVRPVAGEGEKSSTEQNKKSLDTTTRNNGFTSSPATNQKQHLPKKTPNVTHEERPIVSSGTTTTTTVEKSPTQKTPSRTAPVPSPRSKKLTAALSALQHLTNLTSVSEMDKISRGGAIAKILKLSDKYTSETEDSAYRALVHLSMYSSVAAAEVASSRNGIEKIVRYLANTRASETPTQRDIIHGFMALWRIAETETGLTRIQGGGLGINLNFGILRRSILDLLQSEAEESPQSNGHTNRNNHNPSTLQEHTNTLRDLLTSYIALIQKLDASPSQENNLIHFLFTLSHDCLNKLDGEGSTGLTQVALLSRVEMLISIVHQLSTGFKSRNIEKRLPLLASQDNVAHLMNIFSQILNGEQDMFTENQPQQMQYCARILVLILNVLHNLLEEDPNHMGAMRIDFMMNCNAIPHIFHCMRFHLDRSGCFELLHKCANLLSLLSERLFYDTKLQHELGEGLDVLLTASASSIEHGVEEKNRSLTKHQEEEHQESSKTLTSMEFKLTMTRIIHELLIPNSREFEQKFLSLHGPLFVVNNVEECLNLKEKRNDSTILWLDELLSVLLLVLSRFSSPKNKQFRLQEPVREKCIQHMDFIVKKFDKTDVATKAAEVREKLIV